MKKLFLGIVIVGIVTTLFVFSDKEKETTGTVVKIGYLDLLSSAPFYIAHEKGFFEEEGVEVELMKISSANEAYEALVRGDIDFVPSTGILPVLINAPKVGGKVKIASITSLVPGVTFDKLITLNQSIELKSLEGKKVGVFPGTTPTTFLKLFLKKNNVNIEAISFIQTQPQNQIGALQAGSIDALFGYEPIPAIAEQTLSNVKILASDILADVYPESPLGARLASESFVCDREEDFEKIQKAIDKAQDIIRNSRDEYISIVSKRLNIDPEVLRKVTPYYTFSVDKNKIQDFETFLIDNGELKEKSDIDALVDCK